MAGNADISYDIKDLIFTEIDRTSSSDWWHLCISRVYQSQFTADPFSLLIYQDEVQRTKLFSLLLLKYRNTEEEKKASSINSNSKK